MKNTQNYGLNKPEITDYYNVEHQNQNMDIIDVKLKEIDENATNAKGDVDTHTLNTNNPHVVFFVRTDNFISFLHTAFLMPLPPVL